MTAMVRSSWLPGDQKLSHSRSCASASALSLRKATAPLRSVQSSFHMSRSARALFVGNFASVTPSVMRMKAENSGCMSIPDAVGHFRLELSQGEETGLFGELTRVGERHGLEV